MEVEFFVGLLLEMLTPEEEAHVRRLLSREKEISSLKGYQHPDAVYLRRKVKEYMDKRSEWVRPSSQPNSSK